LSVSRGIADLLQPTVCCDRIPDRMECNRLARSARDDVARPDPEEPPTGPREARPDDKLRGVSKDEWRKRGRMVRDGAARLLTMRVYLRAASLHPQAKSGCTPATNQHDGQIIQKSVHPSAQKYSA
jgi:hypothetical protein